MPAEATIVVPGSKATLGAVVRAALEMTATCYVWLERLDDGLAVTVEEREPGAADLARRFDHELEHVLTLEKLERRTSGLRSAMMARALGPRPERAAGQGPPGPTLDPETEAEIERLLAEIEADDWLADAGEIAKTWEERFGKGEGEEEK